MKKTLALMSLTACICAISNANATLFDPYIGGSVQIGNTIAFGDENESISKLKGSYSGFIGFNLPIFRAELEYNYLAAKDNGWTDDLTMHNVMANGYIKPFSIPFIKPYIGMGAGMVFAGDAPTGVDVNNSAAFQGMLGISLDIPAMPIGVDLEYRALYAVDSLSNTVNNSDFDTLNHGVRAKVRLSF